MGMEFKLTDGLLQFTDRMRSVQESVEKVCSRLDAMVCLLNRGLKETEPYVGKEYDHCSNVADGNEVRWFSLKRLRLLQYKDRLETFLGIHMGRYHPKEYAIFRSAPLDNVTVEFARVGKVGALSLLLKRHTYSLAPHIFRILNAIPETLPPYNYSQLLPEVSPPKAYIPRRDEDWVENLDLLKGMECIRESDEVSLKHCTENMMKISQGMLWPSQTEIAEWYMGRAREIDNVSGLLENSVSLLNLGLGKGFHQLELLLEDASDLFGVVFASDYDESEVELRFSDWERLSRYEKFKAMLVGAKEESLVDRVRERALPYMHKGQGLSGSAGKFPHDKHSLHDNIDSNSFLTRWLREVAQQDKFTLCMTVVAEGCEGPKGNGIFRDEEELVESALDCIYACRRTDEWALMASVLAKLPRKGLRFKEPALPVEDALLQKGFRKGLVRALRGTVGVKTQDVSLQIAPLAVRNEDSNSSSSQPTDVHGHHQAKADMISDLLEGRVRQAEDHLQAGQLLSQYQVAKPMSYFLTCADDIKGTKQLFRIVLLKFSRKQPARSDNDWATMWRDMRTLQEKAFPFLDKEFILSELCQALLKTGKFSLAKNYLRGTGTTILRAEKAEKLILQAAREYFYSASSLDSPAIGKARKCLSLLPESKVLVAETNLIDAITVCLPSFEVSLLPIQFRQLKDSMEVVKLAICSHAGAYANVTEIMELATLLGLNSSYDIAAIEAAIAREAAASGDFGLAKDLCLRLINKGYGVVWDLCAALGRGPDFESMELNTRRKLLGFALSHCDEESVGELLSAWKEFDVMYSSNELRGTVDKPKVNLVDNKSVISTPGSLEKVTDKGTDAHEDSLLKSFWNMWAPRTNENSSGGF